MTTPLDQFTDYLVESLLAAARGDPDRISSRRALRRALRPALLDAVDVFEPAGAGPRPSATAEGTRILADAEILLRLATQGMQIALRSVAVEGRCIVFTVDRLFRKDAEDDGLVPMEECTVMLKQVDTIGGRATVFQRFEPTRTSQPRNERHGRDA